MLHRSRREFLGEVGKGMLVASLGVGLAESLGIEARADDGPDTLAFGPREPLVQLMQETSPDALLPVLVQRLKAGTELREIVAAAALANARSFGGEDYVGFHAFMALVPSLHMAAEMPAERRALPVLKVLYRSTAQIQTKGGRANEVLRPIEADVAESADPGERLRAATRARELDQAEQLLAGLARQSPKAAFDALQAIVQDELDVHRVVLAHRAWSMLEVAGKEHAECLLRQSVRYCVRQEQGRVRHGYPEPQVRGILARVIGEFRLNECRPGSREVDDAWVDQMCLTILSSTPQQAAEAVAAALAEGVDPEAVGEAIALAANQQVLRDCGRTAAQAQPGKPEGSVHGDSIGVHASDSVNAWRNIAAVCSPRNRMLSLVAAGAHVARSGQDGSRRPYPWAEHLESVKAAEPAALLAETDAAIRANDQARACALVQRYGDLGLPSRPVFDLLLRYGTSEDGSLHAEKYYRTVREEFGRTRRAFRWRHVVALARVTASEYGRTAPGYEEACRLLRVPAAAPQRG